MVRWAALVAAGGLGTRFDSQQAKQWVSIDGRSVLEWSVSALRPHVDYLIVALTPGTKAPVLESVDAWADGGLSRALSIANMVAALPIDITHVLIHDAARPALDADLIVCLKQTTLRLGSAIPALPVTDTIKRSVIHDGKKMVLETLPRADLVAVQTPQAFRRDWYETALSRARCTQNETLSTITDDAMLLEIGGFPVHLIEGSPTNIKLTRPEDLERLRTVLTQQKI